MRLVIGQYTSLAPKFSALHSTKGGSWYAPENTSQMSKKQIQQTLIGVVLLGALYWYFSPQQNCIRDGSADISIVEGKEAAEALQDEKQRIIEECGDLNAW